MSRKTALIAYLAFIAFGIYEGILGVVWPSISRDLDIPLESLGIVLVISLIGFVLVSFTSGWLIQRKSLYWLLLASVLLRLLGFGGAALSSTFVLLVISLMVASMGGGGLDSGMNGFFSSRGSAKQLNWMHASFGIGATLGPFLVSGLQLLGGGWQWAFAVVALVFGVQAVLVRLNPNVWDLDPAAARDEPESTSKAGLVTTMRLPVVWLSVLVFFLYTGTEISTAQWSFTLFTLARGVPELTASTWIGIYWGIFTLGRIFFGLIANRVRLDPILRLALVLAALGAALLWWNPANWVSFGGLVVMGLAFAPIFPILIATTVNRVGHAHSSNAIGFQIAAAGLGGAVLTGLIGVFASATTLENIGLSILLLVGLTFATYVWLARTASSNPH